MCDNCGCSVTDANRHLLDGDGSHTIEVLENLDIDIARKQMKKYDHFKEHGLEL